MDPTARRSPSSVYSLAADLVTPEFRWHVLAARSFSKYLDGWNQQRYARFRFNNQYISRSQPTSQSYCHHYLVYKLSISLHSSYGKERARILRLIRTHEKSTTTNKPKVFAATRTLNQEATILSSTHAVLPFFAATRSSVPVLGGLRGQGAFLVRGSAIPTLAQGGLPLPRVFNPRQPRDSQSDGCVRL